MLFQIECLSITDLIQIIMEPFSAIPMENMKHYDFPQRFSEFVRQNQNRPQQQRPPCRDWVCLIFLIIAVGGFFGYGGYIINLARVNNILTVVPIFNFILMREVVGVVLGMIALSIGFSLIMLLILRFFPLAGLWTLIALTLGALAGLLIVLFFYGMTSVGIVVAVLLAILVLCVICYSQRIKMMGTVLQTITIFMQERKKIFFLTIGFLLLGIGFMVFWIISYYSMYGLSILNLITETDYTVGFIFWILFGVLWTFWFYYAVVYVVGAETALWFYESELTPVITPIKWLLQGNLGTVTFGAMLLAFIKAIDMILSISLKGRKDREQSVANAIFKCCVCLLQCCLRGVYVYIKILNNLNMIVCSLTGESYLVGLKLTGYLTFKNFEMFELVKLTSYFVYIGGLVLSSAIPTFIGIYLLQVRSLPYQIILTCGAIIFFLSLIIGIVIFSTLMQAVSAMFIMHSFEKCKNQLGIRMNRVLPHQNRLAEHYGSNFPEQMNPSYPNNQIHQPANISQQNIGNEVYNYGGSQAVPRPYNENQRFSQEVELENNPNNGNFPLGYPV